jgi:hypothetical protein
MLGCALDHGAGRLDLGERGGDLGERIGVPA